MKKDFAVAILAVVVAACVDAPTSPRSLLGTGPSLAATTTTTSQRIDRSFLAHVPCANNGAGENVQFNGVLHMTQHLSVSNNGNTVRNTTFNPQGITGTGLVTGDKYQSVGQTRLIIRSRDGQIFSNTFVNSFLVIGPGRDNNLQVIEQIHVATNANGELTATVLNIRIECR